MVTNDSKATVSVLYWYRNYPSLEHCSCIFGPCDQLLSWRRLYLVDSNVRQLCHNARVRFRAELVFAELVTVEPGTSRGSNSAKMSSAPLAVEPGISRGSNSAKTSSVILQRRLSREGGSIHRTKLVSTYGLVGSSNLDLNSSSPGHLIGGQAGPQNQQLHFNQRF